MVQAAQLSDSSKSEGSANRKQQRIEQFTCRAPRFWRGADGLLNLEDDFQNDSSSAAATGTEKCEAWQFNPDHPDRWTMLIEYEMVCDRQYLNDRMQTVLQFGVFLSTLVGPLGDLLGRKTVLVAFCYLNLACNLAVVFVKDLTAQMVLRFFMGCGDPALLMGLLALIYEPAYCTSHFTPAASL